MTVYIGISVCPIFTYLIFVPRAHAARTAIAHALLYGGACLDIFYM